MHFFPLSLHVCDASAIYGMLTLSTLQNNKSTFGEKQWHRDKNNENN